MVGCEGISSGSLRRRAGTERCGGRAVDHGGPAQRENASSPDGWPSAGKPAQPADRGGVQPFRQSRGYPDVSTIAATVVGVATELPSWPPCLALAARGGQILPEEHADVAVLSRPATAPGAAQGQECTTAAVRHCAPRTVR